MWSGGNGPEPNEADSTNTAGLLNQRLGLGPAESKVGTGTRLGRSFTQVMIAKENENPLLPHARVTPAPSETTLHS